MSKPLILVFPFPLLSHYSRCLVIAGDLRDEYEIRFVHHEKYASLINEFGFSTFECKNFNAEEVMDHSRRFSFDWLNEKNLETVFLSQVECISSLKPHFVIGDAAFTLKMAAEKCNVKMIGLLNGYMSQFYALTRNVPHTHPAHRYSLRVPPVIFNGIVNFMESLAFSKVHAPFKKIRRKFKLKNSNHYLDELTGNYTLICDLPELFPQKDLPAYYHFIGPLLFKTTGDEKELLSRLNPAKPTILASMGSTGEWGRLKMLASHKFSAFNIIAAGDEMNVLGAPHIISQRFVNFQAIMPHINLILCHGGNGTIYQALAHDIPILALTSLFEQEYNMQRIEQIGHGQMINEKNEDELFNIINVWISKRPEKSLASQIEEWTTGYRRKILEKICKMEFAATS